MRISHFRGMCKNTHHFTKHMFLKSDLGQFMLSRITSRTTMPLINFADTRSFKVPMLSESEADDIVKKFEHEIELFNEINSLEKKSLRTVQNCLLVSSGFIPIE